MNLCLARTIAAGRPTLGLLAAILAFFSPGPSAIATEIAALTSAPAASAELPLRTRFVIGLERDVEYEVMALANPNRVVVELPDVKLMLPTGTEGAGLVKSFRGGLSAPGRSRVVIDVSAPVVVEKAEITKDSKSHLLMIDLVPAAGRISTQARKSLKSQPSGLGAAGLQPPLPRPATPPKVRDAKAYKPVIVIDPGHGGDDSGATKNGIVEKDAVLAFSKVLRDKLNATGLYRVIMTRDSDVFITLDERRAIAERNKALLFIAVHADYAGSHARGATIYSLTDATANALQRSARAEVVETVLSGKELAAVQRTAADTGTIRDILADLAQREVAVTKERTSTFARSVIEFMSASTSMRENADREANFRVLKTAKVPSVLIELAYVTNAQDAQNLKSEKWRDKVSQSIVTAIDNYFSHDIARLPM